MDQTADDPGSVLDPGVEDREGEAVPLFGDDQAGKVLLKEGARETLEDQQQDLEGQLGHRLGVHDVDGFHDFVYSSHGMEESTAFFCLEAERALLIRESGGNLQCL